MQQFTIDISNPTGPLVLHTMQGDAMSRFFAVTVTDNGAAYTPPDGAIYTVRFGGAPGMPSGWYDTITEVGGSSRPAVVVDANHFRATVDVAPTPPFFSWVFTFGGAIRIEGPAEVLAKMKNMAAWLHT